MNAKKPGRKTHMPQEIKRLNKLQYIRLFFTPILVVIILPILYRLRPVILPNIEVVFPLSSYFLPGLGFLFLLTNIIFGFIFYYEMWMGFDNERYCEIRDTFPLASVEEYLHGLLDIHIFVMEILLFYSFFSPLLFLRRLLLLFRLSNEYVFSFNNFMKQHDLETARFLGLFLRVYPLFLVVNVIVGIVSPFFWDEEMIRLLSTVSTITYITLLVVVWQVCTAVNRLADAIENGALNDADCKELVKTPGDA